MTELAFQVEEANTFVRMSKYDKKTENIIREYCFRNLTRWDKVPGEQFNTSKYVVGHVFATFSPDRSEFRVNKGFYKSLLEFLVSKGIDVEGIEPIAIEEVIPADVKFKWKSFEAKPRTQEQADYLEFLLREDKRLVVINGTTGVGKSLRSDTLVQTYTGWTAISKLKVGDKIIAWDGSVTKVTGVYPQGILPVNKITFLDGRYCYACDEHLWKVFNTHTQWDVINTKEIKQKLHQTEYHVPLASPYAFENNRLPYDPEAIGYFFGYTYLFSYKPGSGLVLIELAEVFKHPSYHDLLKLERIPKAYYLIPVEERLKIIEALIELGGEVLTFTSKDVAEDVQKLIWSLGGVAELTAREIDYKKYVYSLVRKEDLESTEVDPLPKLQITSVEDAGKADCTCISVDHPDKLFVIDSHIVTHNTVITIMGFVKLGHRVIITILPRYVPIWIEAFNKFLDLQPEDVINISDHDLNVIYKAFVEETVNPKIVFFQLTRIDTYIKRMREFPETLPHLDDFFKALKGGIRIIDEAHESIYSVYSSMLYGNVNKNVGLSATLRGDNTFINKIYTGTFPDDAYLKAPIYEKYIRVVNYCHRMNVAKYRVRTVSFGGYSHVLYEQSILRKKYIFDNYYKMCKEAFELYYLENKREGQKAMFFFSTVKMCNAFAKALMKDYPDLDIFVFTGEISKKKGMAQEYAKHDIVITTPTSCGTGKDIQKLFIVFAGVSVSSSQRVDQMGGRLRPIDDWWADLDPIYLTFVCTDVKKQIDYARKRKQVLSKKAKAFDLIDSGIWV